MYVRISCPSCDELEERSSPILSLLGEVGGSAMDSLTGSWIVVFARIRRV